MATCQISNDARPVGIAPNLNGNSPLDRSPHNARVEGDALMATRVAPFDVATECGGAAQFDRTHHAPLGATEPAGMR